MSHEYIVGIVNFFTAEDIDHAVEQFLDQFPSDTQETIRAHLTYVERTDG